MVLLYILVIRQQHTSKFSAFASRATLLLVSIKFPAFPYGTYVITQ
jgi:hypothetical protein